MSVNLDEPSKKRGIVAQVNKEFSCAPREIIVCCVEGFSHFLVGSCAVLGSALLQKASFDTDCTEPFVSGGLLMFTLKGCFL